MLKKVGNPILMNNLENHLVDLASFDLTAKSWSTQHGTYIDKAGASSLRTQQTATFTGLSTG